MVLAALSHCDRLGGAVSARKPKLLHICTTHERSAQHGSVETLKTV